MVGPAPSSRGPREHPGPSSSIPDALVVVNEAARGGRAAGLRRALEVLARGYRVRTASPASQAALASLVAGSAESLVVAVGGDGTVNAVVASLPPHATLGVMPLGTANDLAGALGIPADPVAAADRLVVDRDRPPHRADVIRVNGHAFCTVGGVGLVARTTSAVNAVRGRRGPAGAIARLLGDDVYRVATAAMLVAGRDLVTPLAITWRETSGAESSWTGDVHALFVVNHPRCGGGLALPTGSRGSDGVFELGIVPAGSRPALLANFARLSRGAPVGDAAFLIRPATAATVRLPAPASFVADGELLDTGTLFDLTIDARSLAIRGTRIGTA